MTAQEKLNKALEAFLANEETVQAAICDSTTAGYGGESVAVELFPDGHWRVLWSGHIGNLYNSPGIIVPIPSLADDEYDDDAGEYFFDNAIATLRQRAEDIIDWIQENDHPVHQ